jgi:hypothetical protein
LWGGEFRQVSIFAKLVCQTVGGQFFLFCQDYMDAKLVCQTVVVALTSSSFLAHYNRVRLIKLGCNIYSGIHHAPDASDSNVTLVLYYL